MNFTSPYTEHNPLPGSRPALFRVEGEISDLIIERTTENLLAKMQHASGLSNIATAAAYSGMYGVLANAGMLAAYDGETVYNFICHIDGRPVAGQFERASELKNGDRVIAVLSKHQGVYFAYSLMNQQTGDFMMPLNVFAAEPSMKREAIMHGVRMTIGLSVFSIFVMLCFYLGGEIQSYQDFIEECLIVVGGCAATMTISQFFEYHSLIDGPSEADSIFKLLGFPRPEKIDLRKVGVLNDSDQGWRGAFRADAMLEAMKARGLIR